MSHVIFLKIHSPLSFEQVLNWGGYGQVSNTGDLRQLSWRLGPHQLLSFSLLLWVLHLGLDQELLLLH